MLFCGAIFASFCLTLFDRISIQAPLLKPSHCQTCSEVIPWSALMPIVSYLFNRGRCVNCKAHYGSRYLISECVGAGLALLIYSIVGLQWLFFVWLLFWFFIILNAFFDLRFKWINSSILMVSYLCGLILSFYSNARPDFYEAIIVMLSFIGFFYLFRLFYSSLRGKEMIGEGDISTIGIIALVFGVTPSIYIIGISALFGLGVSLYQILILKKSLQMQVAYCFYLGGAAFCYWLVVGVQSNFSYIFS